MTILALNISKDELKTIKNVLDTMVDPQTVNDAAVVANARVIVNGFLSRFPKSKLNDLVIKTIEGNVNALKRIGVSHIAAKVAVASGYQKLADEAILHGFDNERKETFAEMAKHVRAMTP